MTFIYIVMSERIRDWIEIARDMGALTTKEYLDLMKDLSSEVQVAFLLSEYFMGESFVEEV